MTSFTARGISVHVFAHVQAHSEKGKELLHKGILQKVTFPLISGGFSSVCALQCYCLAKPKLSSAVSTIPGLPAACVISLARHPAACQGKTHCQNSFHQVSYPASASFFPFCSLSQNLTCINSWKSSSSRVGSVSFHQQFNLLCWQAESICTQGLRKNRHILPQSATNEFIEQYTK